jgi:hypothetical protein
MTRSSLLGELDSSNYSVLSPSLPHIAFVLRVHVVIVLAIESIRKISGILKRSDHPEAKKAIINGISMTSFSYYTGGMQEIIDPS